MSVQFGTDPEFVILDDKGNPTPAHKVVPEFTKENKWKSSSVSALAFRDGYNVEFNLCAGYGCRGNMLEALRGGMKEFRTLLPKGYKLAALPTYAVNLDELLDAPSDVREFGCEPSYDAYTGKVKTVAVEAMAHPFRYAGGHMHFTDQAYTYRANVKGEGFDPATHMLRVTEVLDETQNKSTYTTAALTNPDNHLQFIKLLDLYVGLPLSLIFNSPAAFQRRKLYGQAGEFRTQRHGAPPKVGEVRPVTFPGHDFDYTSVTYTTDRWGNRYPDRRGPKFYVARGCCCVGAEYRTPGPELFTHPAIAALAFGVGRWVAENFGELAKKWDKAIEDELRLAINEGKGGDRLLQRVAGYYNSDVVKALQAKALWNPVPDTFIDAKAEMHTSWPEYPERDWGIKVPKNEASSYVEIKGAEPAPEPCKAPKQAKKEAV